MCDDAPLGHTHLHCRPLAARAAMSCRLAGHLHDRALIGSDLAGRRDGRLCNEAFLRHHDATDAGEGQGVPSSLSVSVIAALANA